ncbi:MAG TPA: glycosyltransferase family 4 protein, partial [Methanosarcina barkeri]|nr:glycosyltransferase family 4 protein [Methanosarcina barkeri]
MKIAFVYDAVYPWVKGGAEMRIHELGKRLSARGNEVHIFGVKWWEGEETIEYEGMTLHGVCKARNLYVNGRRSISEAVIFAAKLFPALRKEKFDLIDVSVFPYFSCFTVKAVSVLKKNPSVFTWHEVWDDYWYEYMGRAGFFGKLVEKLVSKISDKNIAVSDWTKKRLEILGVPEKNITVIPNGIDSNRISEIEPEGGQTSAGLESKIYDIIFAGRLIKEKNVDVLIKAVALFKADFPEIRCCIVGDGPEREVLVRLADELGVRENVDFAGFQEYEALIAKIKTSKVLVLPSSREGFGMVVIEAFACRVPVVTVRERYNAAQGLVENSCGIVVELGEKEIAEGVGKILENGNYYEEMAASASKRAEKYEWDTIFEQLLLQYM